MTIFEAKFDREIAIFKNSFDELKRKADETDGAVKKLRTSIGNARAVADMADETADSAKEMAESAVKKAGKVKDVVTQLNTDLKDAKTEIENISVLVEKKNPGRADPDARRKGVLEWWATQTTIDLTMEPISTKTYYEAYRRWTMKEKKAQHIEDMFYFSTSQLVEKKKIPALKNITQGNYFDDNLQALYAGRILI